MAQVFNIVIIITSNTFFFAKKTISVACPTSSSKGGANSAKIAADSEAWLAGALVFGFGV